MIRKLVSLGTLALTSLFVYLAFGPGLEALVVLVPALLTFLWEPAGYLSLSALGILLVYRSVGGFWGLITLVFAIEYVESVYLTKRNAPAEHYYVLFAGTMLAVPIYYLAYFLSFYVPSLVNTVVAALFAVFLYVLFYIVVKR